MGQRTIVLFIVSMLSLSCSSQSDNPQLYELIGLMDFFQGPQRILNHPEQGSRITFFNISDSVSLKEFKKKVLESKMKLEDFRFIRTETFEGPSGPAIYSEKYSHLFNDFFDYEYSFIKFDEELEKEFVVSFGNLKKEKFQTVKQKMFFLKGLFFRYGSVTNEKQRFKINLSTSKHNKKVIVDFLQEVGSEKIEIERNDKNLTPGVEIIYFKPNKDFQNLLMEK